MGPTPSPSHHPGTSTLPYLTSAQSGVMDGPRDAQRHGNNADGARIKGQSKHTGNPRPAPESGPWMFTAPQDSTRNVRVESLTTGNESDTGDSEGQRRHLHALALRLRGGRSLPGEAVWNPPLHGRRPFLIATLHPRTHRHALECISGSGGHLAQHSTQGEARTPITWTLGASNVLRYGGVILAVDDLNKEMRSTTTAQISK